MQTNKQAEILAIAADLASLELLGSDTDRLAKRIQEGQKNFTREMFADILVRACVETTEAQENLLLRFVGTELVIYVPGGYAIVDYVVGCVDYCYLYGQDGENFESMTKPHNLAA